MRILQISNYFYPNIGGIEQTARDIANVFTKENIQNKIICFNETSELGGVSSKRNETVIDCIDDVEVYRCGCICKVASQSISLTFKRQLDRLMAGFDPQIVIFHYPNPFQAVFLLKHCRKRKFKLILYWHLDITKQKVLGMLFYRQNIELLKRAEAIVATSPNYIEGSPFLSEFKRKCMLIPSCISTKRLVISPESKDITDRIRKENKNKIICFAIGRHVEYKGMQYLIEASQFLDDRFVIYIGGNGKLTGQLKEQASNDAKIHFIGKLSDEELVGYYDACDIFAFPSITKNEAFGLTLAEGMYFEKPTVTFAIPGSGVNYVSLDGVTGIECPNRDSSAYAEALKRLADHPELREEYGKAARERVLHNFTKDIFEDNLVKLINEFKEYDMMPRKRP